MYTAGGCDTVLKRVTCTPDPAPCATRTAASWSGPACRGSVSPTTFLSMGIVAWVLGTGGLSSFSLPSKASLPLLTEPSVVQQEEAMEEETTNLGRRNGAC